MKQYLINAIYATACVAVFIGWGVMLALGV